jgi:ligand-binding sensor domain-containing protein/two-component sensor histidine kinase
MRYLLVFLFSANLLSAQELSYKFYGVPEGLVQSQVLNMFQDSKGFLWIGTKGGASRFDGIDFRNFTENDGLINNHIKQIQEDSTGKIWFLTEKGVSKWDGKQFTSYKTDLFAANSGCECFFPSGNDEVTIFSSDNDQKLHCFILKSGIYTEIFKGYSFFKLDNKLQFFSILHISRTNTTYVAGQDGGIFRMKNGVTDTLRFHASPVKALAEGRNGAIYAWADNDVLKFNGKSFEKVHTINKTQSGLNNVLAVDSKGRIYDSEIHPYVRVSDDKGTFRDNFRFSTVSLCFIDHQDNCWIGTETGLFRIQSLAFTNFIPGKCGINQNVWTIAGDRSGKLWFASYLDGLRCWDGSEFQVENRQKKRGMHENDFFYMGSLVDHEGNILFPKSMVGALKYDGKQFTPLFPEKEGRTILFLYQDPVSRIILGGAVGGLVIIPSSGKPDFIALKPGGNKNRSIVSVAKDRHGSYWLGGFDGISIYDHGKIEHLPSATHPFDYGGNAMITDHRGNLWIGNKKGLYHYNGNKFRKIEGNQFETMILALTLIGDSGLLVGTAKGLAWLDLKCFYSNKGFLLHYFDKDNGFQGVEIGQNGFFRDSKGFYWIPTSDRVVRFDPEKIQFNRHDIPCYLSSFDILTDKMEWVPYPFDAIVDSGQIELTHDQKNLRFRFIGIDMAVPERVRYSYILEGYDKGWSKSDMRREAVYTNLPPGQYQFRLMAFDDDGNQSEKEMTYPFMIIPSFRQTWWFWMLVLIVLACSFFFLGYIVMNHRKRLIQEKLESEKKIAELQLISIRNQIDPHFTFNAMNSIASVILKEEKEKAYSFFVKLSSLIRQVLTSGDKVTRTLAEEMVFVQNYLEIEKLRFRESFQFRIDVANSVNLEQEVPKMVVQTYTENALKHGLLNKKDGIGQLSIKVWEEEKKLYIVIEDNGIGRKEARLLGKESTGKGMMILNFYYDFFDRYNDQKILHEVTDMYDEHNEPAGTKVTVIIPSGFQYSITPHEPQKQH